MIFNAPCLQGVVYAAPELLDGSTAQSPEALAAMEKWKANLTEFQEVLGTNEVLLEERGASEESNIGDVICDAFAAAHNNTRFQAYALFHNFLFEYSHIPGLHLTIMVALDLLLR